MAEQDYSPQIYALLVRLGSGENYIGFFQTAFALTLALTSPTDLCMVSKSLYPETAKRFHTSPAAVERNIRSMAERIWTCNPEALSALSPVPLTHRPTTSAFLALLTASLQAELSPRP